MVKDKPVEIKGESPRTEEVVSPGTPGEPQPEAKPTAAPPQEQPQEVTSEPEKTTPKPSVLLVRTRAPEDKVKYLNILDHGDSGVGKTRFAGTMIEEGLKVLYITFNEDELLTLDMMGIHGYDYVVITDYEKQLWPLYLGLRRNKPGYEGLILDGLGDLQQSAKDYELAGNDGVGMKFMEEAMKGNRRMYLQNWGNLLEMTRHFLDPVLKLPLHKIVTCISESDDDPKTGKAKIYPGLQGSMQQLIAAHFSIVAFSYIAHSRDRTYYCLTTQPHEAISTKDRTGLCRVMVNPKFRTFLNAWSGKVDPPGKLEVDLAKALIIRPRSTRVTPESKPKD